MISDMKSRCILEAPKVFKSLGHTTWLCISKTFDGKQEKEVTPKILLTNYAICTISTSDYLHHLSSSHHSSSFIIISIESSSITLPSPLNQKTPAPRIEQLISQDHTRKIQCFDALL